MTLLPMIIIYVASQCFLFRWEEKREGWFIAVYNSLFLAITFGSALALLHDMPGVLRNRGSRCCARRLPAINFWYLEHCNHLIPFVY